MPRFRQRARPLPWARAVPRGRRRSWPGAAARPPAVAPFRRGSGRLAAWAGSRQRPRQPAAPVAAAARDGPAVPAARERPARATVLPPNRPAGRRCAACARAAQEQARGREEAGAALQALPLAALPARALARRSRSRAAAPRAAEVRSAPQARSLLAARPLPPARVAAATWNL